MTPKYFIIKVKNFINKKFNYSEFILL